MAAQTMSIGFTSGTRTTNDSKTLEAEIHNINRLPVISTRTQQQSFDRDGHFRPHDKDRQFYMQVSTLPNLPPDSDAFQRLRHFQSGPHTQDFNFAGLEKAVKNNPNLRNVIFNQNSSKNELSNQKPRQQPIEVKF